MTVRAVGQDDRNTSLSTVVKSTVAGTTAGYVMKRVWPVQKQENTINRRVIVDFSNQIMNKEFADAFKDLKQMTPAQDMFVKAVESGKSDVFARKNVLKTMQELGEASGKEYRDIVRNAGQSASRLAKYYASSCYSMIKRNRPSVPFLVAGAGAGFLAGFAHNVMKCD